MEVLELNGVKYSKASSVARDLGYTSDYVGQLCRSGKVKAKLIGRSWYVVEDSIRNHKHKRHRSAKAKSVAAIEETLHATAEDESSSTTPGGRAQAFWQRGGERRFYRAVSEPQAKYSEDRTELVPILKERTLHTRPQKVSVELADSSKVPIKETTETYDISVTDRPTIQFKGSLEVEELGNEAMTEAVACTADTETTPTSKAHSAEKVETTPQKEAAEAPSKQPRTALEELRAQRRSRRLAVLAEPEEGELLITYRSKVTKPQTVASSNSAETSQFATVAVDTKERSGTLSHTFFYVVTAVCVAFLCGAGLVALESTLTATTDSVSESTYSFNLSSVVSSIKALK